MGVIGMGYVGIPAAALFADSGFDVTGIQRSSKRSGWKIDVLNSGKSPIEGDEPGLDDLIHRVVKEKKTFRVTDNAKIIKDMDIVLIDVQTPTDENHRPQYESLKEVSHNVGKYIKKGTLIIIESTVAPGTCQNVVLPILEEQSGMKAGKDFYLAFSYERVMPGKLIEFLVNFPRVIGGINEESTKRALEVYKKIIKKSLHGTDILTAEFTKTVENAYRDVNIAFANEMALVAESLGVNIFEVRELINERYDRHMHVPGTGVGGHCLPKDSWLLRHGVYEYGLVKVVPEFISLARKINDLMPIHAADLVMLALEEKGILLKDARIAILGIAYLENSDDIRNTPSTTLIKELKANGADVIAHDPFVRPHEYEEVRIVKDLDTALKGADCMVIATKHNEYYKIDLEHTKKLMRNPIIIDGRNVCDKKTCQDKGYIYKGIGK